MLQPRLLPAQLLPVRSPLLPLRCVCLRPQQLRAHHAQRVPIPPSGLPQPSKRPAILSPGLGRKDEVVRAWTYEARRGVANAGIAAVRPQSEGPRQSPKGSAKEQMLELTQKSMPNDLGYFEDTFVMPTGANLPSWFTDTGMRLRVERRRIMKKAMNFFGLIYYKFFMLGIRHKPRPQLHKLSRTYIPNIAKQLHKDVFTAFAEGNEQFLKQICGEGVFQDFKIRLASREANQRQRWEVDYTRSNLKRARVVSDRVMPLAIPGVKIPKGSALRQIVVRIQSQQKLMIWEVKQKAGRASQKPVSRSARNQQVGWAASQAADEAMVTGSQVLRDLRMDEYVVIQQRMWAYELEPWTFWGLAKETLPEDLLLPGERKQFRTS